MKARISLISGTVLFLLFFWACERVPVYVGELDITPDTTGTIVDTNTVVINDPCDPDSVYFSNQVLPILQSNCAMSGCHDVASHKEGVVTTSYSRIIQTINVRPGNPGNSELVKVITTSREIMPPPPNSRLSQEQIDIITKWVAQGAQDNSCDNGCDTTNVTFSGTIAPIMNTYCVGCHGGGNPQGNISLTNYAEVKTYAANGKLMGSIQHEAGYVPMPYPVGANQLPSCYIDQISIWIQSGIPNN